MGTVGRYEERRSTVTEAVVWRSVAAGAHLVLPDGCMDLLWWRGRLVVAGPDSGAHLSDAREGEPVVGLRFDPGALPVLLGMPATELTDRRVDLCELWGPSRTRRLEEQLAGLGDPSAVQAAGVEAAVVSALHVDASDAHARERRHLVSSIASGRSIAAVAAETGWSERHLLRRSRDLFGYGPAVLRRVLRLQDALRSAGAGRPLAQVALDVGYSDQAHLSRDVRSLTGTTISELLGA